ncbi:tyrosine phosphatase family-domain-containing protein [Chaetomidium leptoderma]|uniref:Tyrosine phosphatase family-domain-containing protein n=1 Tax=Chaetomidium leptoderma TaxID=669021 RepID=A0AAN6VD95_9PEZI|nr:tyrosine phosphatase family-domain-containing protein [Chaetomidium leptoderma]
MTTSTSDVTTPEAKVPDARVPDVEVPDAEVPDAEVPDAEVPDAEVPKEKAAADSPTLPSPPFVKVLGVDNLRDAGGYSIDSMPGKAIRSGVLFRSAELNMLKNQGVATLRKLGITHVFDLRSVTEVEKPEVPPPMTWDGAERVFVPVFLKEEYGPAAMTKRYSKYSAGPEGFVKAYSDILNRAAERDHPFKPFQKILEHLASTTPPAPLLVHCTAGKDRTGVIIALILSLCGLPDDVVAHEYSLTDLGLKPQKKAIVDRISGPGGPLFGDRDGADRMVSARKESMLHTLAMISHQYGGAEGYIVNHLGVSQATVAQIRKNLIVDLAEGEVPLDWRSHAKMVPRPHL